MYKHLILAFMVLLSAMVPTMAQEKNPYIEPKTEAKITIQKTAILPALKPVCACESTGNPDKEPTHYAPDGSVLRGKVNPKDIGICQINLTYHQAEAEKMGLDLFKEQDNIKFANWLYQHEGLTPWSWSKPCWEQK